jgi:hypothetical protein
MKNLSAVGDFAWLHLIYPSIACLEAARLSHLGIYETTLVEFKQLNILQTP